MKNLLLLVVILSLVNIKVCFAQGVRNNTYGQSLVTDYSHSEIYAYLFGGKDDDGNLNNELWLLVYDEGSDPVFTKINASGGPSARYEHNSWLSNGKLFVQGGKNNNSECLNDLWEFDIVSQTWTQLIVNWNGPCAGRATTLVSESFIFFFGGSNSSGESLNNFGYIDANNPSAGYYPLEGGFEALQGSGSFLIDGIFSVFGGYWHDWDAGTPGNQPSFSQNIWSFLPETKSGWTQHMTTGEIAELASMAFVSDPSNSFFYVFGGNSYDYGSETELISDGIYRLDISASSWSKLGVVLPEPAHSFNAAYMSGNAESSDKIVLVGGLKADNTVVQPIYIFNVDDNSFQAVTPTFKELEKVNNLKIYPNPVSDVLNFETLSDETIEKISIYSLDGKCVFTIANPELNKVNMHSLMQGNYTIQIYTNKNSYTERFAIIR
jgi:hypothetical protein